MSSARGRALSEQRRHPIHRAKKPWTNTKRPASNQPQNKRGETLVYITPSSKGGMLHCLYSLCSQANAQPSLRRSTVWQPPAETCVYVTPSSKGGMLHCPWTFCPQATVQPSLRRSTVWATPAETIWEVSPRTAEKVLFTVLSHTAELLWPW